MPFDSITIYPVTYTPRVKNDESGLVMALVRAWRRADKACSAAEDRFDKAFQRWMKRRTDLGRASVVVAKNVSTGELREAIANEEIDAAYASRINWAAARKDDRQIAALNRRKDELKAELAAKRAAIQSDYKAAGLSALNDACAAAAAAEREAFSALLEAKTATVFEAAAKLRALREIGAIDEARAGALDAVDRIIADLTRLGCNA